jgi:molybdopterin converting factor subunit 1
MNMPTLRPAACNERRLIHNGMLAMTIHVLFFASFRDIAGAEMDLDLDEGATVAECASALAERFPEFARALPRGRVAVNLELADADHPLRDNDEVAFMPPMSGG